MASVTLISTAAYHDSTAPAAALTTVFTATDPYCTTGSSSFLTSSCMPPRWNLYSNAASYYSPAICPDQYVSAAPVPSGFGPRVESDETAMVCCPSSYTFSGSSTYNWCVTGTSWTTTSTSTKTITVSGSTSYSTSTTAYLTRSTLFGYPIQVRWAESDIPNLQTHPLTPGLSPTTTGPSKTGLPTGGSSSQSTGASNITDSTTSSGLSSGAKAGIGVGSVAAAVLLACTIAFFFLRRRRSANDVAAIPYHPENGGAPGETSAFMANTQDKAHLAPIPVASPPLGYPQPAMTYNGPADMNMNANNYAASHHSYVPVPAHDIQSPEDEYRRVQERRQRLMELQRLDDEEQRLRYHMGRQPFMPELGSQQDLHNPSTHSTPPR